jgi:hypothetical protein
MKTSGPDVVEDKRSDVREGDAAIDLSTFVKARPLEQPPLEQPPY